MTFFTFAFAWIILFLALSLKMMFRMFPSMFHCAVASFIETFIVRDQALASHVSDGNITVSVSFLSNLGSFCPSKSDSTGQIFSIQMLSFG